MTHFRLRYQKLGGHIHVTLWSGTEQKTTHGRNGNLIFREDEWETFRDMLSTFDPQRVEIVTQNAPLPGFEDED